MPLLTHQNQNAAWLRAMAFVLSLMALLLISPCLASSSSSSSSSASPSSSSSSSSQTSSTLSFSTSSALILSSSSTSGSMPILPTLCSFYSMPGASLSAQRSALIDLYCECGGYGWTRLSVPFKWDSSFHECDWIGIECNSFGSVTSILLNNTGLTGQLPASLSVLTNLTQMQFMFNSLVGIIPVEYASLVKVSSFLLRANALSGPFPAQPLCSMLGLTTFDLSFNNFSGPVSECIGNLPLISIIFMSNNQLGPGMPVWRNASDSLTVFDCSTNPLFGTIPSSWSDMQVLQGLFVHDNQLTGAFPLSLLTLPSLEFLGLFNNDFSSGFDCSAYNNTAYSNTQSKLSFLLLSNAGLQLDVISLLVCLAQVVPNVGSLDISSNALFWDQEPLPPQFPTYFPLIYKLTMNSNSIVAPIDYFLINFFALGQLVEWDISDNQMFGTIPDVASEFERLTLTGNPGLTAALAQPGPLTIWKPTDTLIDRPLLVPFWIILDNITLNVDEQRQLRCPALTGGPQGVVLALDDSYFRYQHCSCIDGYARQPNDLICIPCPPYVVCSAAMLLPNHTVESGYFPWPLEINQYLNNSLLLLTNSTFEPCKPPGVCVASASSSGTLPAFGCIEGHDETSLLCSRCTSGFYLYEGVCQSCGSSSKGLVIFFTILGLVFVVVMVFLAVIFERSIDIRLQDIEESPNPFADDESSANQPYLFQRVAVIEIFVFFFQATSVLQDLAVSSTDVQSSVDATPTTTGNSLGIVGRVLRFSPVSFECAFGWLDWKAFFALTITAPIWLAVVVGAGGALSLMTTRTKLQRMQVLAACSRVLAFLQSLVYIQVATYIFQTWRCKSLSQADYSQSFLVAAPYVLCESNEYKAALAFSIIMFIGFILCYPFWTLACSYFQILLANAVFARANRAKTLEQNLQIALIASESIPPKPFKLSAFAMMNCVLVESSTGKTLPKDWSWHAVEQYRKLLLTAVVYLGDTNHSATVIAVVAILMWLLVSTTWIRPYVRDLDDASEVVLLFLLLLSFVVQLTLGAAKLSVASSAALNVDTLQAAANALTGIQWAVLALIVVAQIWNLRRTIRRKVQYVLWEIKDSRTWACISKLDAWYPQWESQYPQGGDKGIPLWMQFSRLIETRVRAWPTFKMYASAYEDANVAIAAKAAFLANARIASANAPAGASAHVVADDELCKQQLHDLHPPLPSTPRPSTPRPNDAHLLPNSPDANAILYRQSSAHPAETEMVSNIPLPLRQE